MSPQVCRYSCFEGVSLAFRVAILIGLSLAKYTLPVHPTAAPILTVPIFSEDFDGPKLDPLKWQATGGYQTLQRTQWGNVPELHTDSDGTTFMRLSLQTYNPNPDNTGKTYLGTQLTSVERWSRGAGLEYETRLRANAVPRGLILGYFAYGDAGWWKDSYQKTEADFEFLSVQGNDKMLLSAWDNWNPLRKGPANDALVRLPGFNWNDGGWNVYKIRWYPDRTEWIVNGRIVHTEPETLPGSPMGMWFNIWSPNPDWLDAFSPTLRPTSNADANQSYSYDVDYARVRRIPAAGDPPIGTGKGLLGTYYGSENFTGLKLTRIDPRIDFNWGKYAPDPVMKRGAFSARWLGLVAPQFSQQYTFTTYSDDGVRVWVDNKLVIDNWQLQTVTSRSGKIRLQAGVKVPIKVEYFNRAGGAWAQLFWECDSTPRQLVPQSQLYVASQAQPPTFSPEGGTYWHAPGVRIASPDPRASIRYTVDGTAPKSTSPLLKPGTKLRVRYTQLVRARAFAPGQAPSESAKAAFVIHDEKAPRVAVTAPLTSRPLTAIAAVSGICSDAVSGVARIDLVLTRLDSGLRWKQGHWVDQEWGLTAQIKGDTWSVKRGLPKPSDLSPGNYELKAVAYDQAGNVAGAVTTVTIVPTDVLRTLDRNTTRE